MASPYQVLRISDPDTAVWGDVYRAYRKRAKETHPDLGGNADEFRAVQEAFDTLLQWAADEAEAESAHDPEPQTTSATAAGQHHEVFVDEHPPPLVTPRIRGAWRRRRPSDPQPYTPRRSAPPTGPRRAALASDT